MPKKREFSDFGPAERAQHDEIALQDTEAKPGAPKRAYVTTESLLRRLHLRGWLGAPQIGDARVRAGESFYGLFLRAGLTCGKLCSTYDQAIPTGTVEQYRVLNLDAFKRYMRARGAIRAGCVGVVYSAAILNEAPGSATRREMLCLGLDDVGSALGIR